jgi:hypothetical protein
MVQQVDVNDLAVVGHLHSRAEVSQSLRDFGFDLSLLLREFFRGRFRILLGRESLRSSHRDDGRRRRGWRGFLAAPDHRQTKSAGERFPPCLGTDRVLHGDSPFASPNYPVRQFRQTESVSDPA